MPHLIIVSDEKLKKEDIQSLHDFAASLETVKMEALKTRYYLVESGFNGSDANTRQVAIELKLLAGRSEDLKKKMAEKLLERARSLFRIEQVSVEVNELGIYVK